MRRRLSFFLLEMWGGEDMTKCTLPQLYMQFHPRSGETTYAYTVTKGHNGRFLPEELAERIIAYLSDGIPNKEGREILEELTRDR